MFFRMSIVHMYVLMLFLSCIFLLAIVQFNTYHLYSARIAVLPKVGNLILFLPDSGIPAN